MPDPLPTVPGENQPSVPAQSGTPAAPGSVAAPAATPAASPVDATEFARLREQSTKFQNDLNALKSASQRRESDLRRQLENQQREFQSQLRNAQMAGMDDEQRKTYESELAREEMQELQQRLSEEQNARLELEGKQNSLSFFTQAGVPLNKLTLDGTLDDLVQSGYSYLAERNRQLEDLMSKQGTGLAQAPAAPQSPAPQSPAPLPQAPRPDLSSGQVSTGRMTWDDVDKKYAGRGGREQFYRDFQAGRINPDVFPMNPDNKD